MAEIKKAKVAIEGIKEECELIEIVNNTAVVIFKGNRTMTNKKDLTPINAEAKAMLGVVEEAAPKKKAPAKKAAAKEK